MSGFFAGQRKGRRILFLTQRAVSLSCLIFSLNPYLSLVTGLPEKAILISGSSDFFRFAWQPFAHSTTLADKK
jgi:hypothetical protein